MQYFPMKNKCKRLQNFRPLLKARRAALERSAARAMIYG